MIHMYTGTSQLHKVYYPHPTLTYSIMGGIGMYSLKQPCTMRSISGYSSTEPYPTWACPEKDVCIYNTGDISTYNNKPVPIASAYYTGYSTSSGGSISCPDDETILINTSTVYNNNLDTGGFCLETMLNTDGTLTNGITIGYSTRFTNKWKCPKYNTYDSMVHQLAGTGTFVGRDRGIACTYYDIPIIGTATCKQIDIPRPQIELICATSGNMEPYNVATTAFVANSAATTSDIQANISFLQSNWLVRWNNEIIQTCDRANFGWYNYGRVHSLAFTTGSTTSAEWVSPAFRCIDITPSTWPSAGVTFANGREYSKLWYVSCNTMLGGAPNESGYEDRNWGTMASWSVSIVGTGCKFVIPTPMVGFINRATGSAVSPTADCAIMQCQYSVGIPEFTYE